MPLISFFVRILNIKNSKPDSRRGFTLIELSVVLAIIALIMGSSMAMLVASAQSAQYNATVNTMNAIEQALQNYTVAFNRLPCPSLLTTTATSPYYGIEAASPGTGNCTGGTPTIPSTFLYQNGTNTYRAAEGGVPTVSLKLPDSYMYDGWGRRIRYAVDTSLTAANTSYPSYGCIPSASNTCIGTNANPALPPPVGGYCASTSTGITVYDYTGATRSSNAAYVLLSHGANGHGAYTAAGIIMNASSSNSAELSNCHCSNSAGSNTYNAQYYQENPTITSVSSPNTAYDDIVAYKEFWQLRNSISSTPTSSTCTSYIWVSDSGNNRVIGLNLNGTFAKQIGCSSTTYGTSPNQSGPCTASATAGQFHNPNKIAIDGSGNLWVADTQNGRIEEFNSGGTYVTSIGGGTLNWPQGVTYNSTTGHLYVVEVGNYDVKEYTTSGGLVGTFGAQAASGVGSCGQFHHGSGPVYTATDSNGNVWVSDNNQYWFQQFLPFTPYTASCPSTVQPAGVQGIATDTFGNIYVASETNGKVYKYSTTNPFSNVNSFNGGTQNFFGATGNGAGLFNGLIDISIDSSGNIWALDTTNKNVQKCTSAAVCSTPISTFNGGDTFSGPLAVTAAR